MKPHLAPRKDRQVFVLREVLFPLLLSVVIGVTAGFGAFFFHMLLDWGSTVLWTTPEELADVPAWLRLLIPAAAGLFSGVVVSKWAPEISGPGVPQVMKALALEGGRIRHRVTVLKALVTSTLISAGASVGREGPIVQIGASLGSSISQLFSLDAEKRRLAAACGAAAGIAATFQAPIAGTMFAVEILLFDLEVSSMSNIVISAVMGTVVARRMLGEGATIQTSGFALVSHWELLIYFGLGIAAGIAGLLLIWSIFGLPRLWKKVPGPAWIKPAMGGVLVGLIGLLVPEVLGVGYGEVMKALDGRVVLTFALILFVAKIGATGICISSGMSGGIFAPSLFIGAMLGTAAGALAVRFCPIPGLIPAHYALVGMGAVVSGTTLAPMTAVLTIFELTDTYQVILPLMVACIPSLLIVRLFHGYSVYETKLRSEGIHIVRGHEINRLRDMKVSEYMSPVNQVIHTDMPFQDIVDLMEKSGFPHFIVLDEQDRLAGVLTIRDIRSYLIHREESPRDLKAEDLMNRKVVTIGENQSLLKAFDIFAGRGFSFLPVVSEKDVHMVVGILKKSDFLNAYHENVIKERIFSNPSVFRMMGQGK